MDWKPMDCGSDGIPLSNRPSVAYFLQLFSSNVAGVDDCDPTGPRAALSAGSRGVRDSARDIRDGPGCQRDQVDLLAAPSFRICGADLRTLCEPQSLRGSDGAAHSASVFTLPGTTAGAPRAADQLRVADGVKRVFVPFARGDGRPRR